jgi:hypothetical protein
MTERFESQRSRGFAIFLLSIWLVLAFVVFALPYLLGQNPKIKEFAVSGIILTLIFALFYWFWTGTHYTIIRDLLIIKCGPFKWKIDIHDIRQVKVGQLSIGGLIKPTLAWKSMELKYKKYGTMHISPKNPDRFLGILKNINQEMNVS